MSWADDELAGPMGYRYAVLFPRARDALRAYPFGVVLPENICPVAFEACQNPMIDEINQETGLAPCAAVHLYGYRSPAKGSRLCLDPLLTGFGHPPQAESTIVSFGEKKFIVAGYGGAFLTNDEALAQDMEHSGFWPFGEESDVVIMIRTMLKSFFVMRAKRKEMIYKWDRFLGDTLIRIPVEQVVPWRVMRRVPNGKRDAVVNALRGKFDVGTNYPPLDGRNDWGDTVINLWAPEEQIEAACDLIKQVIHG